MLYSCHFLFFLVALVNQPRFLPWVALSSGILKIVAFKEASEEVASFPWQLTEPAGHNGSV